MNTAVPYKRPSVRNRHGQYESITFCNRAKAGYMQVKVRIALVWFDRLGWYYHVELEALPNFQRGEDERLPFIHEHSNDHRSWSHGPELPLCAEAAEKEASSMLEAHGLGPLEFNPFELNRREGDPFDSAKYLERIEKDMETK